MKMTDAHKKNHFNFIDHFADVALAIIRIYNVYFDIFASDKF